MPRLPSFPRLPSPRQPRPLSSLAGGQGRLRLFLLFSVFSLFLGCDEKEKLKRTRIPLPPNGITSEMTAPSSEGSFPPPSSPSAPSPPSPSSTPPTSPTPTTSPPQPYPSNAASPTTSGSPSAPNSPSAAGSVSDHAAGVRWYLPASWKKIGGPRMMRLATYAIPPTPPTSDPKAQGECTVFYFGSAQGGSVQSNLERWIGQFVLPPGKTTADIAQTSRQIFASFPVTTVEVVGTFLFSPRPMDPKTTPIPDQRMLGAIVEAPQGKVFFKCVGPKNTLLAARPDFLALLRSLQPLP